MYNDENSEVMMKYKAAYEKYYPEDRWGTFSAAGFLWTEPMIEGLRRAGPSLSRESFLDAYFNEGRHPGFDVTYECPVTCRGFPTDWCRMLCDEGEDAAKAALGGNERLEKVAQDLKDRIHHIRHDTLMDVDCLGDLRQVDLHLAVGTSPYKPIKPFRTEKTDHSEL